MNPLRAVAVSLLLCVAVCQPTTVNLAQTVLTKAGATKTITGPIFVGPTSSDGIVTAYGPEISYWTKNSSGQYAINQTWTPTNATSYQDLSQEFKLAQGFGAVGVGQKTVNIFQLNSGTYGAPNQSVVYQGANNLVAITSIGFNINGNYLAAGSNNGTLNVWNRNSTTNAYYFLQNLSSNYPIKKVATGGYYSIVTLSNDGHVIDWEHDSVTGLYHLAQDISIPNANSVALCADTDGTILVGLNNGSISEYKWSDATMNFSWARVYNGGHNAPVDSITFSQTCDRVASSADNLLYWNLNHNTSVYEVAQAPITGFDPAAAAFSGTQLAVAVNGTGEYKVYAIALNCSNVVNAVSQNSSTACNCKANYTWKDEYCYQIDCSYFNNATTLVNATACNCVTNFVWNVSQLGCQVNCSLIQSSNGVRVGSNECQCNAGFYWVKARSACIRNCSLIANATGPDPNNTQGCICKIGWTYSNAQCVFDCKNIIYASSTTANKDGSCKCSSGYRWDSKVYQCVGKSSNSSLAIGLGVGLGLGIPVLAGLAALLWCLCKAPSAATNISQPVMVSQTAQQIVPSTVYRVSNPAPVPVPLYPNQVTQVSTTRLVEPSRVQYP